VLLAGLFEHSEQAVASVLLANVPLVSAQLTHRFGLPGGR
jgi:hypothetical protein